MHAIMHIMAKAWLLFHSYKIIINNHYRSFGKVGRSRIFTKITFEFPLSLLSFCFIYRSLHTLFTRLSKMSIFIFSIIYIAVVLYVHWMAQQQMVDRSFCFYCGLLLILSLFLV